MNTFYSIIVFLSLSVTALAVTVSNTTTTSVKISELQNKAYGETVTSLPTASSTSIIPTAASITGAVLLNFTVSTTHYNASLSTLYNSTSTAYQTIQSTDTIAITSCADNACTKTSTLDATGLTSNLNGFDSTTTNTIQTTITVKNPVSTVTAVLPKSSGSDVSVFTSNGDVYIMTQVTSYVTGTNYQLVTYSSSSDTVPTYSYHPSSAASSTLDATYAVQSSYTSNNNTGIQFFGSASNTQLQKTSIICAFLTLIMVQIFQ